jgi:Skp family chaperone for outer membrane proteins
MKKFILLVLVLLSAHVFSQRTAYLYTDSVLLSLPDYKVKMVKLDSVRQNYTKEINVGIADVQSRYEILAATYAPKKNETIQELKKRMSVSDTLRVGLLEKEALQWQEKRAIYDKLIQTQYNQEIQPLLNKVNGVITDYAKANGLSAVYSYEQLRNILIYIDPKQNITGVIVRKLK